MTRWTTPSITYRFNRVDVEDIVSCALTVIQGSVTIEKTLTDAVVGEDCLVFTLSQQETAQLEENNSAEIQLRYKLAGGEVGASKITKAQVDRVLKEGAL